MEYLISAFSMLTPDKYTLETDNEQYSFVTVKGNRYSPEDTFEFLGFCDGITFTQSYQKWDGNEIRIKNKYKDVISRSQHSLDNIVYSIEIPEQIIKRMKSKLPSDIVNIHLMTEKLTYLNNEMEELFQDSPISVKLNADIGYIPEDQDLNEGIEFMNTFEQGLPNSFDRKYRRGFNQGVVTYLNFTNENDEKIPLKQELVSFYSKLGIQPGFTLDDVILKLEKPENKSPIKYPALAANIATSNISIPDLNAPRLVYLDLITPAINKPKVVITIEGSIPFTPE